jgi:peptidoglycan hydrolase-like protein with peptidoglycan-binding domain
MSGIGRRVGGAVAVLAVVAGIAGLTVATRPRAATPAPHLSTGTAPVTRGTVTERVQIPGTLTFDGAYTVVHQGDPGVLTAAPAPGTTIRRGEPLYAVANQPVRLLYGAVPAYRDFAIGMSGGPDVAQLERNLAALGQDPGRVDSRFTAATATAIRRWQASWGLPARQRTGRLPHGWILFLPGAVRVGQVQAVTGRTVGPDAPVLSATSTTHVVTARLTADRQRLVRVDDQVQVFLTGAAPLAGRVSGIGRVATVPSIPDGRGDAQPAAATVPVTVSVTLPAGSPDLDQAPVQVAITARRHSGVLMVPVAALLARPGGGYQVRLATSLATSLDSGRYVEVKPGLFDADAGTVEVSGALTEGDLVEVPAG